MEKFREKVAVITGAAEGIGKAIAGRAAAEGMRLVLTDINAVKLASTVRALEQVGAELFGVCADVSKSDQVDALADEVFSRFGNVHLLVNNAGVALAKPVWETTVDDWNWVMGVNLYGVTNSLRAFIPAMLKNDEDGYIVNTASMAGLLSQPSLAAYCASKHAVVAITEGLQIDLMLRKSKIKTSVLCPLWVKSQIAEVSRNRRLNIAQHPLEVDPITSKIEAAIYKAVEGGISCENVAEAVFNAIVEENFYIFTDLSVMPDIQRRMNAILSGNPLGI